MSNWQSSYQFSSIPRGKSQAERGNNPVNQDSSHYLDDQYPDSLGSDLLSIALIGPDEDRRRAAATALAGCQGGDIREFSSYPPSLDDVPKLLEQHYDVIIIDLDSNPEYALELVESICAKGAATVMVYSMKADSELLVHCMRAGAREFLTLPFSQSTMAEALVRASARRPASRTPKKASGRLLAFLGAKGGDGATTLACNFAVAIAKESGQSTLLIDLDLPLGDAGLNLGVVAEYSTINALQNAARLDSSFLSKLLVQHSSGVSVLAAPGKFPTYDASAEAIDRLISVARQDFENVIVDMGSRLDLMGTSLFRDGSTIYLVIQAGIAGLRNSNRLISQFFSTGVPRLEIVLNRYEPRAMGVGEDQITKALTRPAQWKIPNDFDAVRRMQTSAVPLALEDSHISRLIGQMARTACGLPPLQEKRRGFSLKSFSRGFSSKSAPSSDESSLTQLGLGSGPDEEEEVRPEPRAKITEKPAPAAPTARVLTAGTPKHVTPIDKPDRTVRAETKQETRQTASAPSQPAEPETRTYKGATYVKGADGEWHLKEAPSVSAAKPQAGPETRVYKGSTYVKGADGEWRLMKAQAEPAPVEQAPPEPARVEPMRVEPMRVEQALVERAPEITPEVREVKVVQTTPAIAWTTPAPIAYGCALGSSELNAMSSVPGRFAYAPGTGEMLAAGVHTLTAIFTPADTAAYTTAQASVTLTVTKATPAVSWPAPAPVTYGAALSSAQLNAVASVPGRFVYTPAEGEMLAAGVHTLTATFTPTDGSGYSTTQAAVPLTVEKAKTSIMWPAPAPVAYGTPLGASQLNATASVPGRFVYTPAAATVLATGTHTLSATFTPTDATDYAPAHAEVSLTVTRVTPSITWPSPAPIVYGTPLGASQLNATSTALGKFVYIPGAGAVLAAGTHTPSVTFTPADTVNYTMAQAAVSLTVAKATPVVTWPAPAPIAYGTSLGAAQLNATASVPGKFAYAPAAGEVLAAGTHTLSVTFTPTDSTDYAAVQATVSLTVAKAKPTTISWAAPAPIAHGVALSAAQLSATASIPGKFVYAPAAGEVLATGTHTLTVTFTPSDANFPAAQATVPLTVTKATPAITWVAPAAISYGTALSAAQLNATASVEGSLAYTPALGEMPSAGNHTLSVVFTPKDSADNTTAQATVSLTVNKATPIVTWQTPEPISYGTSLGATQLNATSLIPGTFAYTPAVGTVIAAGTHILSVTFTPTDAADYTTAQGSVSLVVEGLPNIASLMPAMADSNEDRSDLAGAKQGAQPGDTPNEQGGLETRTYKGATYVKGADGQWYLQKK
jgi:Flp pilus assembly CpaE family ATPase